jgi:hypothetical protein
MFAKTLNGRESLKDLGGDETTSRAEPEQLTYTNNKQTNNNQRTYNNKQQQPAGQPK